MQYHGGIRIHIYHPQWWSPSRKLQFRRTGLPAPTALGFPTTSEIFQVTFFLFFWSLGRRRLGWPGTAQWDKSGHLSEVCTLMLQDCGPQGCKLLSWRKNEALMSFYEFMGKLRHGRLNQMSVVEPRHSLFFFQLQPSALKRKTLLSLHCFRIASSRFHTLANTKQPLPKGLPGKTSPNRCSWRTWGCPGSTQCLRIWGDAMAKLGWAKPWGVAGMVSTKWKGFSLFSQFYSTKFALAEISEVFTFPRFSQRN